MLLKFLSQKNSTLKNELFAMSKKNVIFKMLLIFAI